MPFLFTRFFFFFRKKSKKRRRVITISLSRLWNVHANKKPTLFWFVSVTSGEREKHKEWITNDMSIYSKHTSSGNTHFIIYIFIWFSVDFFSLFFSIPTWNPQMKYRMKTFSNKINAFVKRSHDTLMKLYGNKIY